MIDRALGSFFKTTPLLVLAALTACGSPPASQSEGETEAR